MLIIQPWLGFKYQQSPEPPALRASFGAAIADPKDIVSYFASSYLSVAVKKTPWQNNLRESLLGAYSSEGLESANMEWR